MPKVSIIVPVYNVENYIEKCLDSLINQTLKDIEIIIVNDGSKDNTLDKAIALRNQFPGSIVVVDKENGGYGSTINESIKLAKGKYYKLLDGDDWFKTENLIKFIDFLRTCDADIVISPYCRVSDKEILFDNHQEIGNTTIKIDSLLMNNAGFVMHEITIKTEVFRAFNKTITEHCFYTDVEFTCNSFISANTIARFEDSIYCYRIDVEGQSISLNGLRKHSEDHPKVINKVFSTYMENETSIQGNKKDIIDYWIENLTRNSFVSYLVCEDVDNSRCKLLNHNDSIKRRYPKLYEIGNDSKLVKTLRFCHFKPYRFWRKYILTKFF